MKRDRKKPLFLVAGTQPAFAVAAAPGVPIACCRLLDAQLSDLAVDAVAVAARAAGADDYLDLVGLQREHGIEAGNAAFREALLRLALRPAA